MKIQFLSVLLMTLGLSVGICHAKQDGPLSKSEADSLATPKDEADKISYGIGLDMGKNFRRLAVDVDVKQILQGLQDGYTGKPQRVSSEELGAVMSRFQASLKDKQTAAMKRIGAENQKAEAAFFAENAKKDGVVTLASGLQYKILQQGSGAIPSDDNSWVQCHYRGKLLDGTEFDSSYRSGKPAIFKVGDATPGWREAMKLMPEGSKWQLFVPSKLGYGERGAGRDIMPNATLIYEIELLSANAGQGIPAAQGR